MAHWMGVHLSVIHLGHLLIEGLPEHWHRVAPEVGLPITPYLVPGQEVPEADEAGNEVEDVLVPPEAGAKLLEVLFLG